MAVAVAVALVICIRDAAGLNFGSVVGFYILWWFLSEFEPTSDRTSTNVSFHIRFNSSSTIRP